MGLLRRRLPSIPEPGAPVILERREIDWSYAKGWEPTLQRVRSALPAHLHEQPPYRNGKRGLWTVVATAEGVPVGLSWSIEWSVDRAAALVEEIAVVPTWQRCGVGRRLVLDTAAWMAVEGYQRLASLPITAGAHHLLDRLGFADDGHGTKVASIATLIDG